MNEVTARCGCKFTFCVNKGALLRWADGSKQNNWRNPADPQAETIWGQRYPLEAQAGNAAPSSLPVVPEAEETENLKRQASTERPLDPGIIATTSLEGASTEDPHVRDGNDFDPEVTTQANLDLTPREDRYEHQDFGIDPRVVMGADLHMTLAQDPRYEEGYESRGETESAGAQNHSIVDGTHESSSVNEISYYDWLDNWIADDHLDTDFADADGQNHELHLRGGGGDRRRETTGRQPKKKHRSSRWRRLQGFYNHPRDSEDIHVVQESSEDEEPYVIQGHPADSQSFGSDQTPDLETSPTSSNENHQIGGHAGSTTLQENPSTGSNSPFGSIESHLTHPKPSEAWPPISEEEVVRINQSIPGQRQFKPSKVLTNNGTPVPRYVRPYTGAGNPSTGPTFKQHEPARTIHQPRGPTARYRHHQLEAPRAGYPLYRAGSFKRRRALRRGEVPLPLHRLHRQFRKSRDRETQRDHRIIPLPWLRRSRVAYITGFASFLFVLILMNSVSLPQLLLIFIIALAAVLLMED